jgi:hypothetical protein
MQEKKIQEGKGGKKSINFCELKKYMPQPK